MGKVRGPLPGGSGGQVIIARVFQTFVEVCLIQRGWHIHHNYSPGLFNNPSRSKCACQCPKNNVLYSDPNFNLGRGHVHPPTLAAIRENFAEIIEFARATPAPSPPPTPACDESESDPDDSGAIARRTRSHTK